MGHIIFVNQASQKRSGYTGEEFKTLTIEPYTSPETVQNIRKKFTEVYRTGLPSEPFEYEISAKDGESHWIEMAISLIKDQAGKPIGFRGVSRDMTERKKREAETIHLTEQLN
jgi:PAS domain S-box-containing protein